MEKAKYYETPETTLVEIKAEGLLCGSTTTSGLSVEKWEDGEFDWE